MRMIWVAWVHPHGEDNESTWLVAGTTRIAMLRQLVLAFRDIHDGVGDAESFRLRDYRLDNDVYWEQIPLAVPRN